ncbi:MAG TPA: nitrate- and nitrite sensing domain-containing protein, partial [Jiangellaceae bacterium]|nr:nitrate- and nitrite sensing domain-containing protein [Jiangellaceae bacterium]
MTRTARGPRPEGVATEPERTDDISPSRQDTTHHGLRYSFLHNRSVRARVAGLVFIPLLGALIFGASVFYDAFRDFTTASSVERNAQTARTVLAVVDRLQDERDVTALLRAGINGDGAVASARDQTDEAVGVLTARLNELPQDDVSLFGTAISEARQSLETLEVARGADGGQADPDRYRMIIRMLLEVIEASGTGLTDADLVTEIDVLDAISRSTESASLERGLVAHLVAIGEDVSDARDRFLAVTRTEQDLLLEPFAAAAESGDWIAYSEARKDVDEIRRELISSSSQAATPREWYEVSSNRINVMRDLQGKYAEAIAERASNTASSARLAAAATALVVLAVLVLTILSAFAVARSIVRPLRRLRSAALEAADTGLPALVSRIQEDGPAVVRRIGDAV